MHNLDYTLYLAQLGNPLKVQEALARTNYSFYAIDMVRRFTKILPNEEYTNLFFQAVEPATLETWLRDPPVSNRIFDTLIATNLLPTPTIVAFVEQTGRYTEQELRQLQDKIKTGNFNPSSLLHLELEYSRYRIQGPPKEKKGRHMYLPKDLPLSDFAQIPMYNGQVLLGESEHHDIERTIEEAFAVFNKIVDCKRESPLLVIGNERYGSYFVVKPLEERLKKLGTKVMHFHVPSMSFDGPKIRHEAAYLSPELWKWTAENNPDILVVDGTGHSTENDLARFPAAMWGYIIAFRSYNMASGITHQLGFDPLLVKQLQNLNPKHPYRLTFWSPEMTERFYVGKIEYPFPPEKEATRTVTIINSTKFPGGYFNDPEEDYIRQHRLVFTEKGFGAAPLARDVDSFVAKIQEIMKAELAKKLV